MGSNAMRHRQQCPIGSNGCLPIQRKGYRWLYLRFLLFFQPSRIPWLLFLCFSMRTNLRLFDPRRGYTLGRSRLAFAIWYLFKRVFFLSSLPWPYALKALILRAFGASVGPGLVMKPCVNIHIPWKLTVGCNVWVGEGVRILNLAPVSIGSNVCISQESFLCAGGHDYRDESFSYRNAPIFIGDGAWIQARVFLGAGVSVGSEAVVKACSVVSGEVTCNTIVSGFPARLCGQRWDTQPSKSAS